jgi:hypothetical protein
VIVVDRRRHDRRRYSRRRWTDVTIVDEDKGIVAAGSRTFSRYRLAI